MQHAFGQGCRQPQHGNLRKTWKREGENRLTMDGRGRHGPVVPHADDGSDGSSSLEQVVKKKHPNKVRGQAGMAL